MKKRKNTKFQIVFIQEEYYKFLQNEVLDRQIMIKKDRPFLAFFNYKNLRSKIRYLIPISREIKKVKKYDHVITANGKKIALLKISKTIPVIKNNNKNLFGHKNLNKKKNSNKEAYLKFVNDISNQKIIIAKFSNFLNERFDYFIFPSNTKEKYYFPVDVLYLNKNLFNNQNFSKSKDYIDWNQCFLSQFWFHINNIKLSKNEKNKYYFDNSDFQLNLEENHITFENNLDQSKVINLNFNKENFSIIFLKNELCKYLTENAYLHKKFLEKYSFPFSKENQNYAEFYWLQKQITEYDEKTGDINSVPKIKNKIIKKSLQFLNTKNDLESLKKWMLEEFNNTEIDDHKFLNLKLIWEIKQIQNSGFSYFKNNFLSLSDELINLLTNKIKSYIDELIEEFNNWKIKKFNKLNALNFKKYWKRFEIKWLIPEQVLKIIKLLEWEKQIGKNEIENFTNFIVFLEFLNEKIINYQIIFKKNKNLFHIDHYQNLSKLQIDLELILMDQKIKSTNKNTKQSKEHQLLLKIKQLEEFNAEILKTKIINLNDSVTEIILKILNKISNDLTEKNEFKNLFIENYMEIDSFENVKDLFFYFNGFKNPVFLDKNLKKLEQLLIEERKIGKNDKWNKGLKDNEYHVFLIDKAKEYLEKYNINIDRKFIKNKITNLLKKI